MGSMGLSVAKSLLPSGVQSTLYNVGMKVIPPPYSIMFDSMCTVYINLEEGNKMKMKEKIVKLIDVMPIPGKSQLSEQVGVVTEICDMKKPSGGNEDMKRFLNAKADTLFMMMDEMIAKIPEIERDPSKVVELVNKFVSFLRDLMNGVPPEEERGNVGVVTENGRSEWKNDGEKAIGVMKKGIEMLKKENMTMEEMDAVIGMLEEMLAMGEM